MIGSRQLVCPAAAPPIRQVQQQAHASEQRCASGATQAFPAGLWEPMGAPEPAASSAQPRRDRPVDAQVGNAARSGRGRGLASGKERRVRSARMCRALLRETREERGKSVMSSSFRAGRAISHSTRRRPGQQATMAPPRIKTRLPLLLPNWMLFPSSFFPTRAQRTRQHFSPTRSPKNNPDHTILTRPTRSASSLLIALLYRASSPPPPPGPRLCSLSLLSPLLALSLLPAAHSGRTCCLPHTNTRPKDHLLSWPHSFVQARLQFSPRISSLLCHKDFS